MKLDRRALMFGAVTTGAIAAAASCSKATAADLERQPDEVIALWPGDAPGGEHFIHLPQQIDERSHAPGLHNRAISRITRPTIAVFRPETPNGSSLLVAPGGGYRRVGIDKEGYDVARYAADRGTTAYVLLYRLPHEGWAAGPDTPLQDSQRALRLIRARSIAEGHDPERISAIGFSAGGHVAAMLATRWDAAVSPPCDENDTISARPNLAGLIYPVITLKEEFAHKGSRKRLVGEHPSEERVRAYSAETYARADMPPIVLEHAADDGTVLPVNSVLMYDAARAAGASAELHVFDEGGHGFGIGNVDGLPVRIWLDLFWNFGARKGVLTA